MAGRAGNPLCAETAEVGNTSYNKPAFKHPIWLLVMGKRAVFVIKYMHPLDERLIFGVGAMLTSGLWFFALAYGSGRLTQLFRHPRAWQTLDAVSGCIMVGMAGALCVSQKE